MRNTIIAAITALAATGASAATPVWLESDSAAAIDARTRADFALTLKDGCKRIRQLHRE